MKFMSYTPRSSIGRFGYGTATTRTAVPSKPDGTGIATDIAFGGNDYALVVLEHGCATGLS
jgi:hypothetical protein